MMTYYGCRVYPGRRVVAHRLTGGATPQARVDYDFVGSRVELELWADRHELEISWGC